MDVNSSLWQKVACFERLFTTKISVLESNRVVYVISFVSNELGVYISAAFQKDQFQANTIKDSILYVYNLQTMVFVSAGGKYV